MAKKVKQNTSKNGIKLQMNTSEIIGKNIKEARKFSGLTQRMWHLNYL